MLLPHGTTQPRRNPALHTFDCSLCHCMFPTPSKVQWTHHCLNLTACSCTATWPSTRGPASTCATCAVRPTRSGRAWRCTSVACTVEPSRPGQSQGRPRRNPGHVVDSCCRGSLTNGNSRIRGNRGLRFGSPPFSLLGKAWLAGTHHARVVTWCEVGRAAACRELPVANDA